MRLSQTKVVGYSEPGILVKWHQLHPGISPPQESQRAIRGTVVNHNDLEISEALTFQAVEAIRQVLQAVPVDDNDGD
jgi:hypothetical protein